MTVANESRKTTRRAKAATPRRRMTEEQFVAWAMSGEHIRAEWVNGEVIVMAPVSWNHSDLILWLLKVVGIFVEERDLGVVTGTEFMARFAQIPSRRMPDLMFVTKARSGLIEPNHFEGAPGLIMEIVSPDSESRDWREKFEEYRKAGVREFWIIDPNSQRAEAYVLRNKTYRPIEEKNGVLRSSVIKGLRIKTAWLWPDTRPSVLAALRELGIKS